MLPSRLLEYERTDDGRVLPRWLIASDAPWLGELAREIGSAAGKRSGAVNERIVTMLTPLARRHGGSRRLVEAVWTVERRRWSVHVDAPVPPIDLRRVLFELAAERPRDEAIATAAVVLGIDAARVEDSLFADRPRARVLIAPPLPAGPNELAAAYNLALVQTLLLRATEIVALVRSNQHDVVGHARRLRLMTAIEEADDGATRMTLSGPLALFHDTVKYGNALARWCPSLVATDGWALAARVVLKDETLRLDLDATCPVPRAHAPPRMHDSRLVAWLDADVRKSGSGWRLEREVTLVRASEPGTRLFSPDFALVSDRGKVLVEIVGWWTPEYLAGKTAMLRAAKVPLVLCVDARRAGRELVIDPRVVPFEKRIDAAALLAACDRALEAP